MSWVLYALISAFGIASADAVTKHSFAKTDNMSVMFVRLLAVLPFTLFFLPWVEIPQQIEPGFYLCVGLLFPLDLYAYYLYMKAIKTAPLSLTAPYLSLTPSFLLLTGFLLLGERPGPIAGLGVVVTTLGAFMLYMTATSGDVPEAADDVKKKGRRLMITVAMLFSVTSAMGKIAVSYTNPLFFGIAYVWLLTGVMAFVVLFSRGDMSPFRAAPKPVGLLGIFGAMEVIGHFMAIVSTQVSFMIAVKRTSLLFAIGYGAFLFREEDFRKRLLAGGVMLAGVYLVTWGSGK